MNYRICGLIEINCFNYAFDNYAFESKRNGILILSMLLSIDLIIIILLLEFRDTVISLQYFVLIWNYGV